MATLNNNVAVSAITRTALLFVLLFTTATAPIHALTTSVTIEDITISISSSSLENVWGQETFIATQSGAYGTRTVNGQKLYYVIVVSPYSSREGDNAYFRYDFDANGELYQKTAYNGTYLWVARYYPENFDDAKNASSNYAERATYKSRTVSTASNATCTTAGYTNISWNFNMCANLDTPNMVVRIRTAGAPALGHDFSYSAVGERIKATCQRSGCGAVSYASFTTKSSIPCFYANTHWIVLGGLTIGEQIERGIAGNNNGIEGDVVTSYGWSPELPGLNILYLFPDRCSLYRYYLTVGMYVPFKVGDIRQGYAYVTKKVRQLHDLTYHPKEDNTCTSDGRKAYYKCSSGKYYCEKYFDCDVNDYSNMSGEDDEFINYESGSLVLPALGHDFSVFHPERREYPCQNGCGIVKIPCYKGVINSICRPVSGKLSYDTNERLYTNALTPVYDFSGIVGRKVYGVSVKQANNAMEAAHPYMFVPEATKTETDPGNADKGYVYFHANEPHYYQPYPDASAEAGNGGIRNGMYGALDTDLLTGYSGGPEHYYRPSPEGVNINCLKIKKSKEYIIFQPDGLHYCDKGNNYLTFGKCFLKSEEVPYSPSAAKPLGAKEIGVFFDGEEEGELPTGVRGVDEGGASGGGDGTDGHEAAYNLRGQRVGAGYKGIIIMGGRKTIRR